MYVNPFNEEKRVPFPQLQPREPREAERDRLFGGCDAEQSADGLSAGIKDYHKAVAGLLQHYWGPALRPEVLELRAPAAIVMTGDATGGWRAHGISHFELSIACWAQGVAVSKLALLPAHFMEGSFRPSLALRTRARAHEQAGH